MKQDKTGKLGQSAPSSGAAPGVEPQAKPSPTALSSGEEWETRGIAAFGRLNAKLRADLTEALDALRECMAACELHGADSAEFFDARNAAYSVLAKARGE